MSGCVDLELAEWALGALDPGSRARVEAHLAACARCREEASAWREVEGALTAAAPKAPSYLRARVLASAAGGTRFSAFVEPLARFFAISVDRARALLAAIEDDAAWEPHESGIGLVHVAAGVAAADTGLVRFPAGMAWPLHRHVEEERHLFLEGGIREDVTGRVFGAGDVLVSPAGSEHSFQVLPDRDCVTAVILVGGIELPPGTPAAF